MFQRERESLLFESSANNDIYMSLNNSKFGYFVYCIYPIEFEIKDTTDTTRSVSYFDLHPEIDSDDWLRTKLCDRRDDFNFPIVDFPFIYSNIPAASTYYGVYITLLWSDIPELVVPITISLIDGSANKQATELSVPSS